MTENNTPEVKAKIAWKNDKTDHPLKAVAVITIADCFKVQNIRLVEGKTGLYTAMPQKKIKNKDGQNCYVSSAYPVTAEMRLAITDAVVKAYQQSMSENETNEQNASDSDNIPEKLPEEEIEEESEVPVMSMM